MTYLSNDLKFIIYQYGKNKSLKISNKEFYDYLEEKKEFFLNKADNQQITFKYKLIRWKQKFSENYSYRPSMYFENSQDFILDKNNLGINIGEIINDEIVPSKELENLLIPLSEIIENSISSFKGIVYYWTIGKIKTDDMELFKEYCLLFN